MEARLIEALADCLERMASGESLENCLHRHPAERAELEPLLHASATLRHLPDPPPIDLAKVEQAALARAAELRAVAAAPHAAGAPATHNLPGWVLPAFLVAFLIALIILACTIVVILAVIVRWPQPVITPTSTLTPFLPQTLTVTPTATLSPTPAKTGAPTAMIATPPATSPAFQLPPPGGDDDDDHDDGDDNDDDDVDGDDDG
jgi:hypothetical protein